MQYIIFIILYYVPHSFIPCSASTLGAHVTKPTQGGHHIVNTTKWHEYWWAQVFEVQVTPDLEYEAVCRAQRILLVVA